MGSLVGRMTSQDAAVGARLRQDTRCEVCGGGLAAGDLVDIQLTADWDEAVFAHQTCGAASGRARR